MKILAHYADGNHTPQRKKAKTFGPLGYYRIIKPTEQIMGHDVTVMGNNLDTLGTDLASQWDAVFSKYDVFWTNYFSDDKVGSAMYFFAQRYGKKVIIDIDDNYLDIPETNLLYDRFKRTKRDRAMLSTILSFADAITVSTFPLKERIAAHIKAIHGIEKDIYVVPNCNDIDFWNSPKPKWNKDFITIGYAGSNSHQDDLMMIMPAIKNLMQKYKNLKFQLIGSIEKKLIPKYFVGFDDDSLKRVELGAAESVFKKYPAWLGQQPWDIGIAPLVDTAFTRCKSHIKWMEYASFKIPTVASRVYPYFMPIRNTPTIIDGETGILCRPNEWEEKLEKMILNEDLRKKIGNNAYNFVKDHWQYEQNGVTNVVEDMLNKLQK